MKVVYNLGTIAVKPHWRFFSCHQTSSLIKQNKKLLTRAGFPPSGWSQAPMSTNVLVTALDSCEPRVPSDHLYKIDWLPSPLEWGYRWRIALTVSLMSPQYGTIRGLPLVREGQWRALTGWWVDTGERDDITTPETTSNNNTICSQHFNGGLAIEGIYVLPQMTLPFICMELTQSLHSLTTFLNWCSVFSSAYILSLQRSRTSLMWDAEMQQMAS